MNDRNMSIKIQTVDWLPDGVDGAILPLKSCYTVILNGNASREKRLASLFHEVCHIWRGDLDHGHDVEMCETFCHEDMIKAAKVILSE